MRNRKRKEFKKAFVLTPTALKGMIRNIAIPEEDLTYSVRCVDGSNLHPGSLEAIFALPNPRSRAINQISIGRRLVAKRLGPDIDITFEDSDFIPISYAIDGEDLEVMQLSRVIEDHLEPMLQAYSIVSVGIPAQLAGIALFWIGGALFGLGAGLLARGHKPLGIALLMFGAAISMIGLFAGRIRSSLFPAGVFCVGDGQARFERSASIRKQLGLAAVIALIIGIIASVIANMVSLR